MKKKKSRTYLVCCMGAVVFLIALGLFLYYRLLLSIKTADGTALGMEQVTEKTLSTESIQSTEENTVTEEQLSQIEQDVLLPTVEMETYQIENPIDFSYYQGINSEVYAYIYIQDTLADTPVLQHQGDNAYYLNYNLDRSMGYPGGIFSEKENSMDFTDNMTVLYGHNMRNGTGFGSLHKFENNDFFQSHPYIYIYTPEKIYQYEIFAAYNYNAIHLLNSYNFEDTDVFAQYLEGIQAKTDNNMITSSAHLREGVTVTSNDKVLTLSTCNGNDSQRWLVQGVLVHQFFCPSKETREISMPADLPLQLEGMKPGAEN